MDMKKNILLSMILLALCLIQASAANYYYKINYYNENGKLRGWTGYIEVREKKEVIDGNQKTVYVNGLRDLINGGTVTDEGHVGYTLPTVRPLMVKPFPSSVPVNGWSDVPIGVHSASDSVMFCVRT